MRCKDPYSYFNGNTCVCMSGYNLFNGQCITCPYQYEWSGTCCSQKTQYKITLMNTMKYTTVVPFVYR